MIEGRRLHQTPEDEPYFRKVREWAEAEPEWLKALDAIEGMTVEDLWESAGNDGWLNIGFFEDDKFKALLTYAHMGGGAFEAHLISERGFTAKEFAPIAWQWGWGLFRDINAQAIYAWIPDINRVSRLAMTRSLALTHDGVVRWHGMYRGKIVKWRRYTLYRRTWESWQTDDETTEKDS